MILNRILPSFIFFFLFFTQGFASHIAAGFSTYKHISGSTYEVKFILLRDQFSAGANFDQDIFVQIYNYDGLEYLFESNIEVSLNSITTFDHGDQNQLIMSNSLGFEYGEYTLEYTLSETDKDYLFVFQRCCRSPNLTNINEPGESGITISSTITKTAQELQNSSIEFDLLPGMLRKVNEDEEIPIEVTSIDGDTLSFQLSPIYLGGGLVGTPSNPGNVNQCDGVRPQGPCYPPYLEVNFSTPQLNFTKPIPGWDDLTMDPQTGDLNGIPSMSGWFNYGFTIHETRNGEIINSTNFDYIILIGLTSSTTQLIKSPVRILGNPSSNTFYISMENSEQYEMQLSNWNGHRIKYSTKVQSSFTELNIDGPAGFYFLTLSKGSTVETIKLVKL